MSSTPKIMSSVTYTRQQMMQAMVRPPTHSRKQFFVMNIKYISSLITFTSNTTLRFSDIFPKRLGIFSPNFTRLLHVPIYARLQIFIQLFATLTKICHIKRDHPVRIICSVSTIGRNARVQMFAKVIDSFVDRCLWQVITDLLQCTF